MLSAADRKGGGQGLDLDLVIFDCDGVLIDSEVISAQVLVELAAESGIAFDLAHVREHFLGRSFPTVAQSIRETHAATLPDDFEARYRARLLTRFETDLRPTPGLFEFLAHLRLRACVATSSSPPRVARSLAIVGLDRVFPHVFTATMVLRGKPAPDLFLHAAASMGVQPERCLVVEDSRPGLLAGQAAGMQVAFFAAGSHLKGVTGSFDIDPPLRAFGSWSELATAYPALLDPAVQDPVP